MKTVLLPRIPNTTTSSEVKDGFVRRFIMSLYTWGSVGILGYCRFCVQQFLIYFSAVPYKRDLIDNVYEEYWNVHCIVAFII